MTKRKENETSRDILLVFIKNPVKGQVKTRLASSVGDEEALRIYQELLGHTRKEAQPLEVDKVICYSHFIPENDEWQQMGFIPYLQEGDDLGIRMSTAFERAFQTARRVVIIGSDCPKITTALLQTAFDALLNNDMVVGPTHDGGYYLLGMNHFISEVFQGIEWSTAQVFPQTIQQAQAKGINPSRLIQLSDVDYIEDWQRYGW